MGKRRPLPIALVLLPGLLITAFAIAQPSLEAEVAPRPEIDSNWSEGQIAAGTASFLTPIDSVIVPIPSALAERIEERTALFYFSPTCPHCIDAMREVGPLATSGDMPWLGIGSGTASEFDIRVFQQDHDEPFEVWIDRDHGFATAVGARSTPNVYVVRPVDPTGTETETFPEGSTPIEVVEAYIPYRRGMGAILRFRSHPESPFEGLTGYQGGLLCSQCHVEEARSWSLSHHSIAYRTLYLRDRAEDTECVGCHVTGLDRAGGFELGDHSSPMSGVGCESCHGPSGPHDGQPDDALASCEGCHDAEHSVLFDVARAVPHIDHYRANSLSAETFNESLIALIDGEAERPLLAFPDGDTVGSSACRSCHSEQHDWLRNDPHSHAMETLGEDNSRPECVRCHSTPQRYDFSVGAMGDTERSVEDYRIDEGVGCEACHGSGEAHIENPTSSNILGLGESCPECIIEGICTSCHTPQWDMRWDLRTRLDAIPH